jgi:integrase
MGSKRKDIDRATGPYRYADRYAVKRISADPTEKPKYRTFPFGSPATEAAAKAEAQAYVDRLNEAARLAQGVTIEEAIVAFEARLRAKGRVTGTVHTLLFRLRNFFPADVKRMAVSALDRPYCEQLFHEMATRPDARPGREGQLPAADTALNTLAVARQLLTFCVQQKWARSNPLGEAREPGRFRPEDAGERNPGGKGKKQLKFDHLEIWEAKAFELAEDGDDGAAAGLIAYKIGLRATKIVTRQAKHVDMDGALLRVPREGPVRTKRTPELILIEDERLRPILASLAKDKSPDDWLFPGERTRLTGHRDRNWVADQIQRVCRLAGVPEDTHAQGMRGVSMSLDYMDGKALATIQEQRGHRQGSDVTQRSYLTAEAIQRRRQRRLMEVIGGGKKG